MKEKKLALISKWKHTKMGNWEKNVYLNIQILNV